MKRFTIIFSLFLFTTALFGQMGQLSSLGGTVYISSQEAAVFATIAVLSEDTEELIKADATDENGHFNIPGLPLGRYIIQVSYVGYQDFRTQPVELTLETNDLGDIQLLAMSEDLEEVVVKAKRPMIEIKPDKTIFNVAGSINAQGGNALELLRKAPGVILDNDENIMLLGKSGVIVYIDGKPSPLSAGDLANFLRGLSSSSIDKIEVITNPSSKYEAEGNAGILNIRLKKKQNIGTHVTLTSGIAMAQHTSYDAGIQLNNRGEKSNFFGSYNYSKNENEQFLKFKRYISPSLYDQDATILNDRKSHNVKIGADYYASEKSTFGVLVNAFIMDGTSENNSASNIYYDESTGVLDQILSAQNNMQDDRNNYNFNLNYVFDNKKGLTTNVDLDYGLFRTTSLSDQPNAYLDGQSKELIESIDYAADAETDIDVYTFKIDFEQPFLKGTLGYGGKLALVETYNDYMFYDVNDNGERVLDINRSNRFLYEENVNAAYFNFQRGKDKWNYQIGLRVEQTNSNGELDAMNGAESEVNKKDYLDFFPSLGVTYKADEKNSFRLSYSRRLNRPNYQDLNPFEFKLDELAFRKGNPFLSPEYTNNFQLGHTFNYSLNTTLSYSRTEDLITRITDTEDGQRSFLTWENLASQDALSLTVSYPFSPTKWWSVYMNVSGNYINNKSKPGTSRFTDEKNVDVEATFVSIFGQNTIQLPKGYNLEISGFFNSPGIWGGNFETDEYWNVDVGVQKNFMDDKFSVKVGVSDVFKSQEWHATNEFGQLRLDGRGGRESRRFKVNLTYNFGNDKIKSRRRSTGLEEEKRRTSGSNGGGI